MLINLTTKKKIKNDEFLDKEKEPIIRIEIKKK